MASNGIRDRVAIVGMGCTSFGEHWDKGPEDLLIDAAYDAYASAPVAQKFSTRVTGLPTSCSGRASAMPLMPDIAVPSQYAST